MSALRSGRQLVAAVRAVLLATVVLGLVYPLLMVGLAQVIAPSRADGSLVSRDGAVVGCIDAGRVGVADRHQDIAILWNCLGAFDGLQAWFLDAYGVGEVDRRKLDFHLMLDEMF